MTAVVTRNPFYRQLQLPILVAIYVIGFWSPWFKRTGADSGLLWLVLPELLLRISAMSLQYATAIVTICACALLAAGALIRVWARGNGHHPVQRLPLYMGAILFAAGVSVLMHASGAAVFLLLMLAFTAMLWVGGRSAARNVATLRASSAAQRWLNAVLQESFYLAFALCFAVFAWRYNPQLLLRCLLICFGISLVLRAGISGQTA